MKEGTTVVTGVDLGDRRSDICVLGPGEQMTRAKLSTTRAAFESYFSKQPPSRVVMEASTHSGWASECVEACGHEVVVANSRRLRIIAESDNKTDRNDAEMLARLGRADPKLLSPIQHRARDAHRDLLLLRCRDALVRFRTGLINCARGLAKAMGERLPNCPADTFHTHVDAIPKSLELSLTPLFDQVEQLTERIAAVEKEIEAIAKLRYPETKRLTQIHGVGLLTAMAFILTVGDPTRFASSRNLGAYFGLRTRRRSSSQSDPELRITKAGDPYVRRLLVMAATTMLKRTAPESDLRTWAQRLAARGGKRAKKVARVALARKLAVVMHRLLITGEDYKAIGYGKKKAA